MDDLIGEFISETTDRLSSLDLELVALEQNPADPEVLSNIFEIVHTIKGTCGFLELPRLASVSSAAEDVIAKIRDKELEATPQSVSLILESLDGIKGLIEFLGDNDQEPEGDDSDLITRLDKFSETGEIQGQPMAAAKQSVVVTPAAEMVVATEVAKNDDEKSMEAKAQQSKSTPSNTLAGEKATAAKTPKNSAATKKTDPIALLKAELNADVTKAEAKAEAKALTQADIAIYEKLAETHIEVMDVAEDADADVDAATNETNETLASVNSAVLENVMQRVTELVYARNHLSQMQQVKDDDTLRQPLQQLSTIISALQKDVRDAHEQTNGETWPIESVLVVESCGMRFALPQKDIIELVPIGTHSEHVIETINIAPVMRLHQKLLPLTELGAVLGLQSGQVDWNARDAFTVVCRAGDTDFGVIVDRLLDVEEIVCKPVAGVLKSLPFYSGNTILGDGSIIMILEPNGLVHTVSEVKTAVEEADKEALKNQSEKLVQFLLFSIGKTTSKAVPLELVERLEEIDVVNIEIAGDEPVIQYRGDLMRLVSLPGSDPLPTEGMAQIVVFNYDKRSVGLVVSQIIDIVHAPPNVKLQSKEKEYLGSMIIRDKITDVVDVAELLFSVIGEAEFDAPLKTAEKKVNDAPKTELQQTPTRHVLLVEDSPFFRNLTVPFLTAAGYEITAVGSGREALEVLDNHQKNFDLIVTDIEMPNMNGFEFTTACRKLPELANTPIIAYTASLSEELLRRGHSVGMNDCILKTDRPGLLQAISDCLSKHEEMAA